MDSCGGAIAKSKPQNSSTKWLDFVGELLDNSKV